MKTFYNKAEILERIKTAMDLATDADLAKFLGISKSTLSNWHARNSMDFERVFSKCELISKDWLLTGEGSMMKKDIVSEPTIPYDKMAKPIYLNNCRLCAEKDKRIDELLKDKAMLIRDKELLNDILQKLLTKVDPDIKGSDKKK